MANNLSDIYQKQTETALGTFRKFLKECAQSGLTVFQIEVIGTHAHDEVTRMITINSLKTIISEDLSDLLQENDAL